MPPSKGKPPGLHPLYPIKSDCPLAPRVFVHKPEIGHRAFGEEGSRPVLSQSAAAMIKYSGLRQVGELVSLAFGPERPIKGLMAREPLIIQSNIKENLTSYQRAASTDEGNRSWAARAPWHQLHDGRALSLNGSIRIDKRCDDAGRRLVLSEVTDHLGQGSSGQFHVTMHDKNEVRKTEMPQT